MQMPDDASVASLLRGARTIAVVGLSDKPDRDSNEVARYLQSKGYRIVPVNPMLESVLGEKSYPSVTAIPPEIHIDILDVFRRSDQVPPIVEEGVRRGVGAVWLQLGVAHPDAASLAAENHVPYIEDACIMVQHRRLRIAPHGTTS